MDYVLEISGTRFGHGSHTLGSNRPEHEKDALTFAKSMQQSGMFSKVELRKKYYVGDNKLYATILEDRVYYENNI